MAPSFDSCCQIRRKEHEHLSLDVGWVVTRSVRWLRMQARCALRRPINPYERAILHRTNAKMMGGLWWRETSLSNSDDLFPAVTVEAKEGETLEMSNR